MSSYGIPTYADPIQAMAMRIAERLRNSVGFALLYAQAPWRRSAMQRRLINYLLMMRLLHLTVARGQ
jgi:hypothetical protein